MSNWINGLTVLILGIVSIFTGEIVTFVMLGFILLSLNNIYRVLKKIHVTMEQKKD